VKGPHFEKGVGQDQRPEGFQEWDSGRHTRATVTTEWGGKKTLRGGMTGKSPRGVILGKSTIMDEHLRQRGKTEEKSN